MQPYLTNRKRWAYIVALLAMMLALFASAVSARDAGSVAATPSDSPSAQSAQKDAAFNCSQAAALSLDKQMNNHAAQLLAQCGKTSKEAPAPSNPSTGSTGSSGSNPGNLEV